MLKIRLHLRWCWPVLAACFGVASTRAQIAGSNNYQGSVVRQKATQGTIQLSLNDAIQLALRNNLGAILQSASVKSAGGERLLALQSLLPSIQGTAQDTVSQVNLQAEGLRIAGFPAVIGPFGYTDFRATLNQALLNVSSIENYVSARHLLSASKLSAADAGDLIVLSAGNAYLLCVADAARISSIEAQVQTSKVSLDQAVQNHRSGVSPRLDELRARVDYQTQQQSLISARNDYQKDRISLARTIGLPLDQKFELADKVPFAETQAPDLEQSIAEALKNRNDLKAARQEEEAARRSLAAARAERLPALTAEADYGYIGVNPNNSYATFNATGKLSGPIFEEGKLRGDADIARAQLEQAKARRNNLEGQVRADVKNAILDIQAAEALVTVSRSNVALAGEALKEAQDRFQAGVSDNLAVSQAQSAVAEANNRYVSSVYQFNVARLSLARATGVARLKYKTYLEGQ